MTEKLLLMKGGQPLIERLTDFIKSLKIKINKEANKYEDPDFYSKFKQYENAVKHEDGILSYTGMITSDMLVRHFGISSAQADLWLSDENFLLNRTDTTEMTNLLNELRTLVIDSYIENNSYYRRFMGLPSSEGEFVLIEDLDNVGSYIYLHEVTRQSNPLTYDEYFIKDRISDVFRLHPKLKYLEFLRKPLNLLDVRTAKQFDILYYDSLILDNRELESFLDAYEKSVEIVSYLFYDEFYEQMFEMYPYIYLEIILFYAVGLYFINLMKLFNKRNYTDSEIYQILDTMNMPKLKKLDMGILRKLVENIYRLRKNRGKTKVLQDILDVVGLRSSTIRVLNLVKKYNTELGEIHLNDNKTYYGNIELGFIDSLYSVSDEGEDIVQINEQHYDYETVVAEDPLWGGRVGIKNPEIEYKVMDALKADIIKEEFNILETKYISISQNNDTSENIYKIRNMVGLLLLKDNEESFMDEIMIETDYGVMNLKTIYWVLSFVKTMFYRYLGAKPENFSSYYSGSTTIEDVTTFRSRSETLYLSDTILDTVMYSKDKNDVTIGNILEQDLKFEYVSRSNQDKIANEGLLNYDASKEVFNFLTYYLSEDISDFYNTFNEDIRRNYRTMTKLKSRIFRSDDVSKLNAWEYMYDINRDNVTSDNLPTFVDTDIFEENGLFAIIDRLTDIANDPDTALGNLESIMSSLEENYNDRLSDISGGVLNLNLYDDRESTILLGYIRDILSYFMSIYSELYTIEIVHDLSSYPNNRWRLKYNLDLENVISEDDTNFLSDSTITVFRTILLYEEYILRLDTTREAISIYEEDAFWITNECFVDVGNIIDTLYEEHRITLDNNMNIHMKEL